MSNWFNSSAKGFGKWLKGGILFILVLIPLLGFTGIQLENHDQFCTSCHTEPESTYVDRSHMQTAVDLASFHSNENTRCIDCHSGEGLNGRLHAMTVGGSDLLKFVSNNYSQPAPLSHPISDDKCLKCHDGIFNQRSFDNHFHAFLPKWQQISDTASTCVDCHQSHTTNNSPQLAFLSEQQTVQNCNQCHREIGEG